MKTIAPVNDLNKPELSKDMRELLPESLLRFCKKLDSNILNLPEVNLREYVRPDFELNCLRSRFWEEYYLALGQQRMMEIPNIVKGICSEEFFVNLFESDKKYWLFRVPKDYKTLLSETASHGLRRIREIMELPLYDQKGDVDHKSAKLILDVYKHVESRILGTPETKIKIDQNVDVQMSDDGLRDVYDTSCENLSIEEIEAKIKELRGDE